MPNFDSKSILTIVGTYEITTDGGTITSHNVGDDILTIIYNNSFYQATVDTIPMADGSNNFSVITEVPDFNSTKIAAILRTTLEIDGDKKEVLLEYTQPISQPDNFLDQISELSLSFQYRDGLTPGCIYPEYPNYDCNARLDNNSCSDDNFTGCNELIVNDEFVCTCNNIRCQDLCEFCGTDEEWRCSQEAGFYNPSQNILHSDSFCTTEPLRPLISFRTSNHESGLFISDWRNKPEFLIHVDTRDNDDLNSFDILSFEIHKAVLPSTQNAILSFLDGSVDPGHTIDILNQGSISRITINFDSTFTGSFNLILDYDDLVTWKICLNNILFLRDNTSIEHYYDKSCIELNPDISINIPESDLLDNHPHHNIINRKEKLDRLFQPASDFTLLSNNFISTQDNEPGKLYTQELKLHRGINEISLFANARDDTFNKYFLMDLILDLPFIERIETFNGAILRNESGNWIEESQYDFNNIDSVPDISGLVAGSFQEVSTGSPTAYTITICSDRLVEECYDNGILKDSFEIEYNGYLSFPGITLHYGNRDLRLELLKGREDNFGSIAENIFEPESFTLKSGLTAQCKESLYDDINTILAFEDNISAFTQQGPDDLDYGLQGKYIDLIQYETELITHVDMDFDCNYDEYGTTNFGDCYDTWLGTLTTLELGNGYAFNMNTDSFIFGELGGFGGFGIASIHSFVNMYYDFCGICSGGPTLHIPNSDIDDNAFCIDNLCYNGINNRGSCFTNGERDDICFGNCCLYPDEIVDWYEEIPEHEIGKGKSFGKKLRLCDNLDEYSTYRCSIDEKEYPTSEFCNSNCNGECTQINYYKEFDNCKGILDCLGNCNPTSNQLATYDRYGTCCVVGNMDECGICYGDSTSCDTICDFDFVPSVNITFNIETVNQSANNNSGIFKFLINLGSARVSEIVIPIHNELKITNVYFDDTLDISSVENIELFNVSALLDQGKILISSIEDAALLSASENYNIPLTVEWEINLPNNEQEVDNQLTFDRFCIDLPEVYRLDSLLSTTLIGSSLTESIPNVYCFDGGIINVYGCTDDANAINYNFYCGLDSVTCIGNGICEYQGCFDEIINDPDLISQLDDCEVCNGGNADQDCLGICFGDAIIDECGICDGPGVLPGNCDCDDNTLDCAGECGGSAEIDQCDICNGNGTSCVGCMDDRACNFNPSATIDDIESCIFRTTYYLDADGDGIGCLSTAVDLCPNNPILATGLYVTDVGGLETAENCACNGTFDQCGVCNGTNECIGCTDLSAYNYDSTAEINCEDCCIYLDDIFHNILSDAYSDGSLDDWLVENTTDQATADSNLFDFLEEYGGVQIEYPNIYIQGGFDFSNFNEEFQSARDIVSYPFDSENYYNLDQDQFTQILELCYMDVDGNQQSFEMGDTVYFWYNQNIIGALTYFGSFWQLQSGSIFTLDHRGFVLVLYLNKSGIINWNNINN